MSTISNLVIKIKANTKQLRAAISSATKRLAAFAKKASLIGAGITAAIGGVAVVAFSKLTSAIMRTADALDSTIKTADNLGLSVEALQRLGFQAEQSGVSTEQLTKALQQMVRVTGEANQGSKRAVNAFADMGISLRDLVNLNPEQLFHAIASGLNGMSSSSTQAATASVLFGRNWLSILNLLRSDLSKTAKQFDSLGIAITHQQGKAIEAFNDARNRLNKIWGGFFTQLTAQSAGAFTQLLEYIESTIIKMGGLRGVAQKVSQFMVSGVIRVTEAFGGLAMRIIDAEIAIKRLEVAYIKFKQLSVALVSGLADAGSSVEKSADQAGQAYAKMVLDIEKEIGALFKKKGLIDKSPVVQSLKKLRDDLSVPTSFIQSIVPLLAKPTTDVALLRKQEAEAADKAAKKAKKRNDLVEKWKMKLREANQKLKESNKLQTQLQRNTQQLAEVEQGGGLITQLQNAAKKASSFAATAESARNQRLFKAGLNFLETGGTGDKKGGELLIKITTDDKGIIKPVVESKELSEKIRVEINGQAKQQARINDR